jgi:hypothetical protein
MYLIFGGEVYYSNGGAYDLITKASDLDQAKELAKKVIGKEAIRRYIDPELDGWSGPDYYTVSWSQVFDCETGKIVFEAGQEPFGKDYRLVSIEGINNL